jgi:outer membrane protein
MKKLIILFFVSCSISAVSQHKWTLEECIKYALTHNIELKQAALSNETTLNNSNQTIAGALPSLNANAQHMYNIGKSIDRFTNTFAESKVLSQNFFLSSSFVVWGGLSQYNNVKSSRYQYLSGVEQLKQQEYDLSLAVANAYINVIFTEELLKISQNQFKITDEQLTRTTNMVTAGAMAKSVEYDIKAQLANEEVNVTTADNNYAIALLSLMQMMNLDSVTNFNVVRPDLDSQESVLLMNTTEQMYETSLKTQPIIKSGEYSIRSAESNLAASKGRVSPSLTFNANIGTGTSGLASEQTSIITGSNPVGITASNELVFVPVYETRTLPFSEQFQENISKSFGVTLSVPLFNGLQTHTQIKNAKLNTYNAKLAQDLQKQNLYKDIAQAQANAKAALNRFNATKISAEAAKASFDYAQEKFNAGVISSFEFSSAKTRLVAAESNLVQAKYDYVFKLKVLDFYQGKPLTF